MHTFDFCSHPSKVNYPKKKQPSFRLVPKIKKQNNLCQEKILINRLLKIKMLKKRGVKTEIKPNKPC
ncbi:hypothetical protein GCM10017764_03400 [Sphingobacterium griseoflavum]|uniref:Uncharacterized protein n=1 Tax=Sphingobacterium griseoflavum TaxID=1474952 RepID=A0ABQ3HU97_9SPHI|nr:hypothetical protein GCM10017764_03400 [Sphingobacterium griseoflavum]